MLTVQTLDYSQKIQLLIRVRPMPCRHPIPDTIGRCYTDTDTWLNKFFCTENAILCGYRCVHVIYVCGIYVRKYGIGLKL